MVTVEEPESAPLADEVAFTVTVAGFGMEPGAVYNPDAVMVPTVGLPPAVPLTCQVTTVFVVPVAVAVNCFDAPGPTVAEAGVTVTVIGGGGGVLPQPQEPRNRETSSISKTARCIRSLASGVGLFTL